MEEESLDITERDDGSIAVLHVIYDVSAMGGNDIETFYCFDKRESTRLRTILGISGNENIVKAFESKFDGSVSAFISFCEKKGLKYSIEKRY